MKRAVAVLLTLALMLSLTACMSRGSMQLKRADRYFDDLRGAFKMSDVTSSAELIGRRKNRNGNWFIGSYTAQAALNLLKSLLCRPYRRTPFDY